MHDYSSVLETCVDGNYGRAFLRMPLDNSQIDLGWDAFRLIAEDLCSRDIRAEELTWSYAEENYSRTVAVFEVARDAWRGAVPPRVGSIPPHTDAEFEGIAEVSRAAARALPRPAWSPERFAETLQAARKPAVIDWPAEDPKPEVTSLDPRPADAPAEPKAVLDLARLARGAGFEARIGYSRGPVRAVKRGTYKRVQAFSVWGLHGASGWRFVAVHQHSPDLKGPWKWDSVALWLPGSLVAPGLGTRFVDATVTDLKEWLGVSGNVGPAWFKAVHARVMEQAERTKTAAQQRPAAKKNKEGAS